MQYFKNGKVGWFAGCKFKVVSRRKWNGEMVYALKYSDWKPLGYESHRFLKKEKCFHYDAKGNYMGAYYEKET